MSGAKTINLAALRARLWSARGNIPALTALGEELAKLSGPGIGDLQKLVAASLEVRPTPEAPPLARSAPAPLPTPAPSDFLGRVRARAKTPGQPLYRYGVGDEEFATLRQMLETLHRRGALEQANDRTAAAFVLYCAEWFRREYAGGGYSWDGPLAIGLSHPARKALALDGLRWWGRSPRRAAHGELRLMSLALEGGFPTRLLETREHGRIAQHLARLLSQAEAVDDANEEDVEALSKSMGESLGTYNHGEFHALCAELVCAILVLKAEAQAQAPQGVPPTSWLDGARPDWRDDLPIALPGEGARRLLDDLVSAAAGRIAGEGACITRVLVLDAELWRPAAVVRMAGEIDMRRTGFYPSDGRLRVRAAHALAGVLAGELGLIDPPVESDQHWLCRPRGGRDFEVQINFNLDLELELRSVSSSNAVIWPGGAALRGEVLVFADPAGDDAHAAPKRLAFLGQGSVRTRRKQVYCAVPSGYRVRTADGGQAVEPSGTGPGILLYKASQSVLLTSGTGDTYRIDVGADSDHAEHLSADGVVLKGVDPEDPGLQIFRGSPTLCVRTAAGRRVKDPPAGEISWRPVGESTWRAWPGPITPVGLVEAVWRDGPSGVLRDRLRFVVVPSDLVITSTPTGHFKARIEIAGAADWSLAMAPSDQLRASGGPRRLDLEVTGQPQRRVVVELSRGGLRPVKLCVRPRYSAAAFFRADGRMFPDRIPIMVDDLRGAAAYGEGREQLYLRGPAGGFARIDFDDEVPLWSITEDVARLLSGGRDLDDHVEIEFGRGGNTRLTVGRYSSTIEQNAAGLVFVKTGAAAVRENGQRRLEWFSILEPSYHLLAEGREFALMPPALHGPGVAVLREAGRIIGRPTFVQGSPASAGPDQCELQRAILIVGAHARAAAIGDALDRLGDPTAEAEANHSYLHRLVSQLDGLPPIALDPLKHLATRPAALAMLLARAPTDELRAAIWRLERDLPFLWASTPERAWSTGLDRQKTGFDRVLRERGIDPEMAASIAQSSVRSAAMNIADLDPALRVMMTLCGRIDADHVAPPSVFQAAHGRVTRVEINERDPRVRALAADSTMASCFRPDGAPGLLPNFSMFLAAHWEGLDAACACALSAAGLLTLSDRQILAARTARAEEPVSFNDMYAAALSTLARGGNLLCAP